MPSLHVRRAGLGAGRRSILLLSTMMMSGCARIPGTAPPVTCEGSSAPDRWTLQTGGVLQGAVADTRGLPITGATVRIRRAGADSTAGRTTTTAGQGAFAFDSIPPGRYVAQADAPRRGTWRGTVEVAEDRGTIPRIRLCRPTGT